MMKMMMMMKMDQPECEGGNGDELKMKLQNWGRISRQSAINSRRHSASYIRSFGQEEEEARCRSLRTNITISTSTASSPGYPLKDEIDPSTYSFTTALRALQGRSGWVECGSSPEGVCLNSKWNEAEKYICNPLSGQFPLECLSAKTLSNRITMSAPLAYYCSRPPPSRTVNIHRKEEEQHNLISISERKLQDGAKTRDAGTQITPPGEPEPEPEPELVSSGSPSPASTPSILDTSFQCWGTQNGDSSTPSSYSHSNSKPDNQQVEVKGTVEGAEAKLGNEERSVKRRGKGGCFSMSWMRKRQPQRQKWMKANFFLSHLGRC